MLAPASRVAVVGAGFSGIAAARALLAEGFDVTVFEQRADVGGVWSESRRYPGISAQDDRISYAFSDTPMPADVAEHPEGADIRRYLQRYADDHGITSRIRLRTTVVRAQPTGGSGVWSISTLGPEGEATAEYDQLIAANGTFSSPYVPAWPGADDFERAGGMLVEPGTLGDGDVLRERDVVVVGWGKTACDVAVAAAGRARSVDVIARTLTWKYPKRIGSGALTYRHLVLTRFGQWLLWTGYRGPTGRLLLRRLPARPFRRLAGSRLARAIDSTIGLSRLGLHPAVDVGRSHSLVTDGFFEAVEAGRIAVQRDVGIGRLGADDAGPFVELTDGRRLPAGVVVPATGYDQTLDFLSPDAIPATASGSLAVYRRVLALDVPRFAIVGWMYNYHSPLTAEVTASWLAAVLTGRASLPSDAVQRRRADHYPLRWRSPEGSSTERLPGVTIGHLDAMLAETGRPLPRRTRLRQLWRPLDPADYAAVLDAAPRQIADGPGGPVAPPTRAADPGRTECPSYGGPRGR